MKRLLLVLLLITVPFFASAQSINVSSAITLLQAQIQDLLKQIQNLQQQVTALTGEVGGQPASRAPSAERVAEVLPPELTRPLSRGSSGDDVRALQEFLSRDRDVYPEKLVTGYYGPLTEAAVKRWQAKHGVETAGSVGEKTIAAMKAVTAPRAAAPATRAIPAQPVGQSGTTTVPAIPALPALSFSRQDAGRAATTSTTTPALPTCATDYSRCRAKRDCEDAKFFWYTVSCHPTPPPQSSCAASYNYCAGPTECSAHGWYWCRSSCYASVDACLGETYLPPAVPPPATAPTAALPATPAQPVGQTGTTTVPAVPAIPAQTATTTPSISIPPPTATSTATATTTALANTGACTLNALSSTFQSYYTDKPGVNTLSALQSACTSTDYKGLLAKACSDDQRFYGQEWVTTRDANANQSSATCGPFGCGPRKCSQLATYDATVTAGACYLYYYSAAGASGADRVVYQDPDSGTGYAKKNIDGSNDLTAIRNSCTKTIYDTLLTTLCTAYQSATGMQESVMAFDAKGGGVTFGCAAGSSCVSRQCPTTATPPAPTNVQAVTTSGSQPHPPQMWYNLTFNYTLQSTTQSFTVYRKRPTDASFVKYTYSAQTPVNPSILPLPGSNESNLYHRDTNRWEWWTTLTGLAPDTVQGEYKFYVTAVDTNGVESSPSETKSFKLYAAPVIQSPSDGATVSAPFTITVSGDPTASGPNYGMAIYKKTTGDTAWSAWPAPSTNFTYTGPTLNPSDNPHRLVVWFTSGSYDRSLFATSIFSISTTTASLDHRAKNLAAVAQTLDAIKDTLLKLLQGL